MCNYESHAPDFLSFKRGDLLTVTTSLDQDWIFCKLGDKEGNVNLNKVVSGAKKPIFAVSKEDYTSTDVAELSLKKGDIIAITSPIIGTKYFGQLYSGNNLKTGNVDASKLNLDTAVAKRDCLSSSPDDYSLSFKRGDVVTIIRNLDPTQPSSEDYWAELNGNFGNVKITDFDYAPRS